MNDLSTLILVKYIHLISIFGMIACLAGEILLTKKIMTRAEIKRVSKLDGLYGLTAVGAVAAGLTLWFGVGKGFDFYNHGVMHLKVTIVVIVGLLSIFPTVFFLKNRKGNPNEVIELPKRVRQLIILQLALLALVPPLATMLAYGVKM